MVDKNCAKKVHINKTCLEVMLFETDFNKLPLFSLQVDSLKLPTGKDAKQNEAAKQGEANKPARPTNWQDRHHLKDEAGKS